MNQMLEGVRVLECGPDVAVRYLGRLFATLGAEVVQVAHADDTRLGYAGDCGEAYGRWLDAGKVRAEPSGRFDVVVGGLDAESIERAEALQRKAGGVLVALSWFDPAGPYGDWRATDEIITALCGVNFSFGERAGPPMLAHGHIPQITTGVIAFNATIAALLERPDRRPGRVDLNVFEAAVCFSEPGALGGAYLGTIAERLGVNRYSPTFPCTAYPVADGWIGVSCLTPAQWGALCRLVGRPDMASDPRCAISADRVVIGDELDAVLDTAFLAKTQAEWVQLGIQHRIPIAPMVRPGELPSVDHWRERGAFAEFGVAGVLGPTMPYRWRFDGVTSPRWTPKGGEGPLAGLKVVDFSMGWAGPLCARTLADLGADVVKIESEEHPDWWRGWDGVGDVAARESQVHFINNNRNKRCADIDLTQPEGQRQARALIAGADMVIENYGAGVLDKLGLGQATQRSLRPGLISLTMPAFGAGGPLSPLRAYGSTVEQASGMPFVNGEANWAPAQQHVALGDPIGGIYGASAVLAALFARDRLGGADLDLSQVACLFQLGADAIIAEQVLGGPAPRTGHARPRLALCTVVQAAGDEQWLTVVAEDEAALQRLERVAGGRDREALARWAAPLSPHSAAQALQAAGVAAAPLNAPHALTRDPQLQAVGYFLEMERAYVGRHPVAHSPFRFDRARPAMRAPAPVLGEHTAQVMQELAQASTA